MSGEEGRGSVWENRGNGTDHDKGASFRLGGERQSHGQEVRKTGGKRRRKQGNVGRSCCTRRCRE